MFQKSRSVLPFFALSVVLLVAPACGSPEADPTDEAADSAAVAGQPAGTPAGEAASGGEASPARVASVNDTVITGQELDDAIESFIIQQGQGRTVPPDQQAQVRQVVLDALIGRELLYQHSVSAGIKPTEDQVTQTFDNIRSQFNTEDAWQAYLAEEGVDAEQARERVRRNLAIDKVVQETVLANISVSPEEIRSFYDQNPDKMQQPETVRARHILLRVDENATEAERDPVRARIGEILARARQGADFAALATENSEDPGSAQKGGDLGYFARGTMVPPFEAAAFALKPGEISDVVETPFGYHIIKLEERRPAGTVPLEQVSDQINQFLKQQKAQTDVKSFVQGLRDAADVQVF